MSNKKKEQKLFRVGFGLLIDFGLATILPTYPLNDLSFKNSSLPVNPASFSLAVSQS